MASRRGIILSVLATMGGFAVIKLWSFKKTVYKIVFITVIIVLSLLLLSNPRFKAIKEYKGYKYDIRLTMWKTALDMVSDSPSKLLMGYGLKEGYEEYNRRLRRIDYFPQVMKENFNSTHNDFLDIFIMFGLIGLIFFLAFFIFGISHAIRSNNIFILSFIIMTMIQFFFSSYFFWFRSGKYSFFFLFSILLLFDRHKIKNPSPKDSDTLLSL
jgi:O-antigen ligase